MFNVFIAAIYLTIALTQSPMFLAVSMPVGALLWIIKEVIKEKINDTRRYISDDRIRNGSERKANQEPQ
jgi:hypothetical protein